MTYPEQEKELPAVSVDEVHQVAELRTYQAYGDPVALRLPFLIFLITLLVSLCVSIALLWHFSDVSQGFDVGDINHYVLTYGPTAILVWIVAAWRQIDFHTKNAAPWCALSDGPTSAKQSILLDYVSTFQAAALWTSLRNRHVSVVLSILGFVLLKITTLSSTGLLVLQSTPSKYPANATSDTAFGIPVGRDFRNATLTANDPSLVYTTYGILAQNLPKPFGLGNGLAYSTFSLSTDTPANANATLRLEAFVPSYRCQQASLSADLPLSNSTDPSPQTLIRLLSPACTLRLQTVAITSLNPRLYRCPERQLSGFVRRIDCDPTTFGETHGAYHLIVMADMRYSQELNETKADTIISERVNASSWSTNIAAMSGLVCRLDYSLQEIVASTQIADLLQPFTYRAVNRSDNLKLSGFEDTDLDQLFTNALVDSDGLFGSRDKGGYALEYPDPMLKLMALVAGGGYESLLNATAMSGAAERVATQIGAQIGHQYLRVNRSASLPITILSQSVRVRVTTISAWTMSATLIVVVVINSCLLFSKTRSSSMEATNDSLNMVAFQLMDPALIPDLLASQSYTEAQLQDALRGTRANLMKNWPGSNTIVLQNPADLSSKFQRSQPWWHPITVSKPVLALTFIFTILIVAVLEVLQRISDSSEGFVDVTSSSREFETICIQFLPALVVLLIAAMFNCLDFNVLLLSPFHKMRTGLTLPESNQRSLISQVPPAALWSSLRRGYYAAFASSSAALIGSLMTVVVSGLYNVDNVPLSAPRNIQLTDFFDPTWVNSVTQDNGAALIGSLTENLGFANPIGTYDELAFPYMQFADMAAASIPNESASSEIRLDDMLTVDIPQNSTLSGIVPSWRADLECITLPETNFSTNAVQSRIVNTVRVNATYGLPSDCLFGGENGTESTIGFAYTFPFSTSVNSTPIGKMLDLHVGPYDPVMGSSAGEAEPLAMNDNPLGCPSLAFIYGIANLSSFSDITQKHRIAVEVCYQRLQKVDASVNFLNSDFEIDSALPPLANESTAEYVKVTNGTLSYVKDVTSSTSFHFRIQEHFDTAFAVFNGTNENPFGIEKSSPIFDNFFQGTLFGKTSLPLSTMELDSEANRKDMKRALLLFYRRYMAQAISLNFRVAFNQSDTEAGEADVNVLSVTVHSAKTVRRVVQHKNSKLVLQVMLSSMFICGIISLSTIRMQKLLPASANPCTIWGQASIWAGSRFYEHEGKDLLHTSARGQEQRGRFKLGSWHLPDGTQRYGVDIVSDRSS